ncbi:MAG: hypothetical protein GY894_06065 [Planctomycetes bacterium]|nr:hypothetical protein [Planctomycetota bacterium]MCP4838913.1 hypothetical protein [Planctomycetota bacterium]
MKLIALGVLGMLAAPALGSHYVDLVGDIATGNSNLDIAEVEMTDNGVDLEVRVTVASLDGDWGKYLIFIDALDGGSGDNDNAWQRDISGLSGMDIFAGSWLDGGGGVEISEYGDSGWETSLFDVSISIDWDNHTFLWTFVDMVAVLSSTGITGLDFEVATTGGNSGDPAIDLLGGEGTQPGWGGGSHSTDLMHYDFTTIPAPGVLSLLGLAGIAAGRRRRR